MFFFFQLLLVPYWSHSVLLLLSLLASPRLACENLHKPNLQDLLPFDLEHVLSVQSDDLFPNKFGFSGREGFAYALAEEAKSLIEDRAESIIRGTAFVVASSAGVGKTRGMLELRSSLPNLLREEDKIDDVFFFGYAGFNTGLGLSDGEELHATTQTNAKDILARRVLGSVVTSFQAESSVHLPGFESLYGNRKLPSSDESLKMLESFVNERKNDPEKISVVTVGIDEVQLLDEVKVTLDFPSKSVGLGRLFLRILRDWQVQYWGKNILILPVGTGITIDFTFDPTDWNQQSSFAWHWRWCCASHNGGICWVCSKHERYVGGKVCQQAS